MRLATIAAKADGSETQVALTHVATNESRRIYTLSSSSTMPICFKSPKIVYVPALAHHVFPFCFWAMNSTGVVVRCGDNYTVSLANFFGGLLSPTVLSVDLLVTANSSSLLIGWMGAGIAGSDTTLQFACTTFSFQTYSPKYEILRIASISGTPDAQVTIGATGEIICYIVYTQASRSQVWTGCMDPSQPTLHMAEYTGSTDEITSLDLKVAPSSQFMCFSMRFANSRAKFYCGDTRRSSISSLYSKPDRAVTSFELLVTRNLGVGVYYFPDEEDVEEVVDVTRFNGATSVWHEDDGNSFDEVRIKFGAAAVSPRDALYPILLRCLSHHLSHYLSHCFRTPLGYFLFNSALYSLITVSYSRVFTQYVQESNELTDLTYRVLSSSKPSDAEEIGVSPGFTSYPNLGIAVSPNGHVRLNPPPPLMFAFLTFWLTVLPRFAYL